MIVETRPQMSNKQSATSFLKMASSGEVRAAYEKFVAPNFIHHNQYFKGDRESLMVAMEQASKTHPNKAIDIKHVYEDGDTVITHSLVTRQDPAAAGIAVVHIFRFESGRIAELWDLGQEIAKDSRNENGLF
jgi:predicted SnoaL-like aldol condensation-catalyzing enzyme